MAEHLRLYSYWRSSAAYRVRIGLNLKGLAYETAPVHLVRDGGQQHAPDYVAKNPQHMVPTLQHGARVIRQSLAILEYLDEAWPSPRLLPMTARDRARVRALAQMVACDIHPLNNLRVLQYFEGTWNVPQAERDDWVKHWIIEGFAPMEALLAGDAATGAFCHGQTPGLADCCLVPQVFNARRFGLDLAPYSTVRRIAEHCEGLVPFQAAHPARQPDAE